LLQKFITSEGVLGESKKFDCFILLHKLANLCGYFMTNIVAVQVKTFQFALRCLPDLYQQVPNYLIPHPTFAKDQML
jgi:hypothetical protein